MCSLVTIRWAGIFAFCVPLAAACTSNDDGRPATGGGAGQATAGAAGATNSGDAGTAGDGGTPAAGSGGSAGSGIAGSAGAAGEAAGGNGPGVFVLPAYTGSAATTSGNLGTRNAGHEFTVTDQPVVVRDLGIWDNGADGLAASHVVTLFALDAAGAGATATPVTGGSVTVPPGTTAELEGGFRFAPLATPLTLTAGDYAVVAYGLNADDLPGDGGGLPLPLTGIQHANFDPYEFVGAESPVFPSGGDQNAHANASLRFESGLKPLRIMPLGASITDGHGGTMAGYRGPLKALLDEAGVPFQFVGSWSDNPGTMPLPLEQQHHEGHPGYVILSGTSGRSGIHDFFADWLGPRGSQADLFLIVIGTNDVDLDYELDTAGERLDAMVTAILEPTSGLQPDAHVVLAQLPPIDDAATDARCLTYNQAIVATVEAHQQKGESITSVDLHAAITTDDLADKLHPNDAGYQKIAQVFFDAIQELGLP
jgi:lysophospholipase L1-like esterase